MLNETTFLPFRVTARRRTWLASCFVPYRGGAPALTDVIAGVVPMIFYGLLTESALVRSGTARVLGISSPRRNGIPEVPAIAESRSYAQVWWAVLLLPVSHQT